MKHHCCACGFDVQTTELNGVLMFVDHDSNGQPSQRYSCEGSRRPALDTVTIDYDTDVPMRTDQPLSSQWTAFFEGVERLKAQYIDGQDVEEKAA